ncbi:hypothetical protein VP01_628g9 [Puccinia sorghi]|uniref:Uncharacterized protein n=1 Tax=Puccinia sorghi TaxID=27349 RepID=A0A0L6UH60_9BASI|nr:hypothetical protein VP01_628g9 [Puccinia sorghi]
MEKTIRKGKKKKKQLDKAGIRELMIAKEGVSAVSTVRKDSANTTTTEQQQTKRTSHTKRAWESEQEATRDEGPNPSTNEAAEEPQSKRPKTKHPAARTTPEPQAGPADNDAHWTQATTETSLTPMKEPLTKKKEHRKSKTKNSLKHHSSAQNDHDSSTAYNLQKETADREDNTALSTGAATNLSGQNKKQTNDPSDTSTTPDTEKESSDLDLDRVLVDSKNIHILRSKSHLPDYFMTQIPFLTCHRILSSKWLSMTHLNELSTLFGLKYKKGQFSATEQAVIENEVKKYCESQGISRSEFGRLLVQKRQERGAGGGDKIRGLAPLIAEVLPGRPLLAIWKHVRRAYDPHTKLGRWTPGEEDALQKAHLKYGSSWTTISQDVGRSADDCRDRWKNYTCVKQTRLQGRWSKEEEERLMQLVSQAQTAGSNPVGLNASALWTWVSSQMGGSRSRAQCRAKWSESLQPKLASGSVRKRWLNKDVLILAQQLKKYDMRDDEVGFQWKQVRSEVKGWESWDNSYLQRRWKTLKKYMLKKHQKKWEKHKHKSGESEALQAPPLSNQQIIRATIKKWSAKEPEELDAPVHIKKPFKKLRGGDKAVADDDDDDSS